MTSNFIEIDGISLRLGDIKSYGVAVDKNQIKSIRVKMVKPRVEDVTNTIPVSSDYYEVDSEVLAPITDFTEHESGDDVLFKTGYSYTYDTDGVITKISVPYRKVYSKNRDKEAFIYKRYLYVNTFNKGEYKFYEDELNVNQMAIMIANLMEKHQQDEMFEINGVQFRISDIKSYGIAIDRDQIRHIRVKMVKSMPRPENNPSDENGYEEIGAEVLAPISDFEITEQNDITVYKTYYRYTYNEGKLVKILVPHAQKYNTLNNKDVLIGKKYLYVTTYDGNNYQFFEDTININQVMGELASKLAN